VRQVAFVDDRGTIPDGVPVWRDEAAYAHLLEVVCGLHSPIVGETEVLHQFKIFAESLPADYFSLRELCSRLLADARTVRAQHLIGLGSRSYGSAVRRSVRQIGRVAVLGTGMLARDIVPFLVQPGRVIDLWGRRPDCDVAAPGLSYRRLDTVLPMAIAEPSAIVIAAPVSARDVTRFVTPYVNPQVVVDLRAEGAQDPLAAIARVISLADVFASMQEAAHVTSDRVIAAKAAIGELARVFATRAKLNPSGWHDLCA